MVCCLFKRRQSGSTLFPYTTLFRSWAGLLPGKPVLPPPPQELAGMDLRVEYTSILAQAQKALGVDRKSTRLNSSHVRISYAVFCLKKKIKMDLTIRPY